jgi:hypothetical protein
MPSKNKALDTLPLMIILAIEQNFGELLVSLSTMIVLLTKKLLRSRGAVVFLRARLRMTMMTMMTRRRLFLHVIRNSIGILCNNILLKLNGSFILTYNNIVLKHTLNNMLFTEM